MRALGFCVSVAHAEFMARQFTDGGPAVAGGLGRHRPRRAQRRAQEARATGDVRALFAVDLFNEGVDLPEIDTVLFLRPTESALVFLQQLGRGLRRDEGKDCVTVLDFIGQAHRQFRFDLRYRAVTGATRRRSRSRSSRASHSCRPAARCSWTALPRTSSWATSGKLSRRADRRWSASCAPLLASDQFHDRVPALREFLDATGLELGDIYKSGCWSGLKRAAGVAMPAPGPHEEKLGDCIEGCFTSTIRSDCRLQAGVIVAVDDWTRRVDPTTVGRPALQPDTVQRCSATRWRPRCASSTSTRPSSRSCGSSSRCWTIDPITSPIRWTRSWTGRIASRSRFTRATACVTSSRRSGC